MTGGSLDSHNTARDAFFILSLLGLILVLFLGGFGLLGKEEPDPPLLENRINPNDASIGHLTLLPGIGLTRAQAIVAYRQQSRSQPPFQCPNDLTGVKGIGPHTVQRLEPWLLFPDREVR